MPSTIAPVPRRGHRFSPSASVLDDEGGGVAAQRLAAEELRLQEDGAEQQAADPGVRKPGWTAPKRGGTAR